MSEERESEPTDWLIVKRGLYYKPDNCGYTGIRDHAGRYSREEAEASARNPAVSIVRLADAPEFSEACFDDLARAHLIEQRDSLQSQVERLKELAHSLGAAVVSVACDLVDENDIVYLGSTNDANELRSAKDEYDAYRFETGDMGPDDALSDGKGDTMLSHRTKPYSKETG